MAYRSLSTLNNAKNRRISVDTSPAGLLPLIEYNNLPFEAMGSASSVAAQPQPSRTSTMSRARERILIQCANPLLLAAKRSGHHACIGDGLVSRFLWTPMVEADKSHTSYLTEEAIQEAFRISCLRLDPDLLRDLLLAIIVATESTLLTPPSLFEAEKMSSYVFEFHYPTLLMALDDPTMIRRTTLAHAPLPATKSPQHQQQHEMEANMPLVPFVRLVPSHQQQKRCHNNNQSNDGSNHHKENTVVPKLKELERTLNSQSFLQGPDLLYARALVSECLDLAVAHQNRVMSQSLPVEEEGEVTAQDGQLQHNYKAVMGGEGEEKDEERRGGGGAEEVPVAVGMMELIPDPEMMVEMMIPETEGGRGDQDDAMAMDKIQQQQQEQDETQQQDQEYLYAEEEGAFIVASTRSHQSSFDIWSAAKRGDLEGLRNFWDHHRRQEEGSVMTFQEIDSFGNTCLYYSSHCGHVEVVHFLLELVGGPRAIPPEESLRAKTNALNDHVRWVLDGKGLPEADVKVGEVDWIEGFGDLWGLPDDEK